MSDPSSNAKSSAAPASHGGEGAPQKNYNRENNYKSNYNYKNYNQGESYSDNQYRGYGRGRYGGRGRGRGRGRGYYNQNYDDRENNYDEQQDQPKKVEKVVGVKSKQNFKYTTDYDKAFGQWGQEEVKEEPGQKEAPEENGNQVKEEEKVVKKQKERKGKEEEMKGEADKEPVRDEEKSVKNETEPGEKHEGKKRGKKNGKNKEEEESKEPAEEQKDKAEEQEKPKEEVQKKPQVSAFVPDQNFAWDLDLESQPQKKGKKKPVVHIIKNSNAAPAELREEVKLKLSKEIDFEILSMHKVNKGLSNEKNNCFMNVCLQSLMACPPFFNMLVKISEKQDVIQDLGEDSLLRKFAYLSNYFNPQQQIDPKSEYAQKVVRAEDFFDELLYNFNPDNCHQDAAEFLTILLDTLHDELKTIYIPQEEKEQDSWKEVGSKSEKKTFNSVSPLQMQQSLISDIFGGSIRTEFNVEGRSDVSITLEPFFTLNLEISRCEEIQSCLESFFQKRMLHDYKVEGVPRKAWHNYMIDKLPKILVLHLKRFIYRERPIKMKEDIWFPEVLEISDFILSPHLRLGAFDQKYKTKDGVGDKRSYRLFSVVNHKGNNAHKGHYVCYTLDAQNKWVLYDDDKLLKVHVDKVLESQAYQLFYELIH